MDISTKERGNGVIYGESPHMINLTGTDTQTFFVKEPLVFSDVTEEYSSKNIFEESADIFQEVD